MSVSVTVPAQAAYLVAALLFIGALAGLSKHETAKVGLRYGMAGMAIALVATVWPSTATSRAPASCSCSSRWASAPPSASGVRASSR
jgi:NAD/NADP transhydrogenase beta subunit